MDMYLIYYPLHSLFLLVNWGPYVRNIFLRLLYNYRYICAMSVLWKLVICAQFALENASCNEFDRIFLYDIFICIKHVIRLFNTT